MTRARLSGANDPAKQHAVSYHPPRRRTLTFASAGEVGMAMTRKQFLQSAAALATTGLFACIGDDPAGGGSNTSSTGGSRGEGESDGGGSTTSGGDSGAGDGDSGAGDAGVGGGDAGGDGGGGGGGGPRCLDNGTNVAIGNNHGHALVVSKQDVADAADKTYSILGGAGHSHEVTLTAAHFAQLAQNQSVTVASTTDAGHSHTITVTCV
ncbi:MAG: hypothetical protein BGO98_39800 [Myxococcales bacterium 68-20]|nr:MAG: hypothetical protein BGO98_39800 [Myxococcales bacterium 68-20]